MLAVRCCSCGYGIICPSYGLYGSIFIYYKAGLHVSGCMRTYAYNLTLRGAQGTCAPLGVQILSISCSFWEHLAKSPQPRGNPGSAIAIGRTKALFALLNNGCYVTITVTVTVNK